MPEFSSLLIPALFALLYIVGAILALVHWKRYPGACAFVLVASILNLVVSAFDAVTMFMHELPLPGWSFKVIGLVSLIGSALMLAAVFANRSEPGRLPPPSRRSRPRDDDDDERDRPRPSPPSAPADSTDIQERQR